MHACRSTLEDPTVSGAYLNPVVTAVEAARGRLSTPEAWTYAAAQVGGGIAGAVLANLMYSLPAVQLSTNHRGGAGVLLGEVIATFGLVLIVVGVGRLHRWTATAAAVGAYIAGAYFFTSSTSFANPAVTVARSLSDTFAGIAPASALWFVLMEMVGGLLGFLSVRFLFVSGVGSEAEVADG